MRFTEGVDNIKNLLLTIQLRDAATAKYPSILL